VWREGGGRCVEVREGGMEGCVGGRDGGGCVVWREGWDVVYYTLAGDSTMTRVRPCP